MKKINKIALAIFLIIIFIGIILIGYIEKNKEKMSVLFSLTEAGIDYVDNNLLYKYKPVRNVFDEIYKGEINSRGPYYTANEFSLNRIKWLKHIYGGGGMDPYPFYEFWTLNEENLPSDGYKIGKNMKLDVYEDTIKFYIPFILQFEGYEETDKVSCVFDYSPKEKTLYQSVGLHSDKITMTEEQLKEYQHYALYDMLIKSWCETNPSAFSVDDIGDITIIDGKRPK